MTPETALLKAITERLVDDAGVAALVAGRVFDAVPNDRKAGSQPPYIYVGPMNRQRVPLDCAAVWQVRARVYVVTTTFGRAEGWEVIEAVVQALDGREAPDLALPAPFTFQNRLDVVQAGDVVDPLAPKSMFLDLTTIIARTSS